MLVGSTRCGEASQVFQAQTVAIIDEVRGSIRGLLVNGKSRDALPVVLRAGDRVIVLGTGELFHTSLKSMPWPEAVEVRSAREG